MISEVQVLVIGSGPAGMAAALALNQTGIKDVLVVEREEAAGGILLQCIHNGFGLHKFKEELTGPEYAERYLKLLYDAKITILVNTSVIDIINHDKKKKVILISEHKGLIECHTEVIILAMGCRERNRGNIAIPGCRPAGIMTAGFAQKMVNLMGCMPGKEIVILGSGDIGLIMARRLTWEGAHVKGVIEIQPYPGGLIRNIVQCLNDFNIPLYLSHTITNIIGKGRIESVEVSPIDQQNEPKKRGSFILNCDTLLLSVGLIPENELSIKAGIELDPVTHGPVVDSCLMTSVPGIFACGNVLHVHDLVDYVSEEAELCGSNAALYLEKQLVKSKEIPVKLGNLVRYVLPPLVEAGKPAVLSLRPMAPADDIILLIKTKEKIIYKKKYRKVFPSTMLRINVQEIPAKAKYIEIAFQWSDK